MSLDYIYREAEPQMTLERLKQYKDQKNELQQLKKVIKRAEASMYRRTADAVCGSMTEYPYIERTVVIRGMEAGHSDIMRRRIALLEHRRAKLAAECLGIETWITSLTDSKLRQSVELHFIRDCKWQKVAKIVYGAPRYEDAAKKRVYRFLKKGLECPE